MVDGDGKPVRSKSGYKLFQDTVEQKELQITYTPVSEAKEPIDLVAVVQLSSVMEPAIKQVRSGIEKLAKSLLKHHADSRVALIGFATEVKRLEDFGHPNAIARDPTSWRSMATPLSRGSSMRCAWPSIPRAKTRTTATNRSVF